MSFKDKVAIVAGGGGGLGRGISVALGTEGAQVVIWDINEIGAMQTEEETKVYGGKAQGIKVDVSRYEEVREQTQKVLDQLGQIDIMIVTVGGGVFKSLSDMTPQFWQRQVDYNIKTVFNCFHCAVGPMIKRSYGKLLSYISTLGGLPGLAAYGAGKAAVWSLTRSLATELAPYKINVNTMGPKGGGLRTQLTVGAYAAMGPAGVKHLEESEKRNPRGVGTVADNARVALFLVSDESERVTGQLV